VTYTAVGGLKATFLTDYLHTTVALILLLYFSLAVLTNEHIGGLSGLYQKARAAEVKIDGNYEGSLLTMKSRSAVLFGIVLKFGNLVSLSWFLANGKLIFLSERSANQDS
jgi:urea-proton symporter